MQVGSDQNVGRWVGGHKGIEHPEIREQEPARLVGRNAVPTRKRPKDVLDIYSAAATAGAAGAGAFFSRTLLKPLTSFAASRSN